MVNCSLCGRLIDILSLPEVKMGYVECTNERCRALVDQTGKGYLIDKDNTNGNCTN